MRLRDTGMYDNFEAFERAELLALDTTFVDEMTDSFFEDSVSDGLRAVSYFDDDE